MDQQPMWQRFLRGITDLGPSLSNVMAPLRSAKGTFGAQRAESAETGQQRRSSYPHD